MANRGTRKCILAAILFSAAAVPLAAQGTPSNSPAAQATPAASADTSALSKEALGWLAQLIQINTTNPPGNELPAAKFIAGVLEKEGITPELLEIAPGRSVVIARLRSSAISDPS